MRTIFNFRWGSCKIKLNMSLIYTLKRSNLAAYIDVFLSLKTSEVALNIRANKWISDLLLPQYTLFMVVNGRRQLSISCRRWVPLMLILHHWLPQFKRVNHLLNKLPITIFGLLSVPVNHKNCISELFPGPCLSNLNRRQNIR